MNRQAPRNVYQSIEFQQSLPATKTNARYKSPEPNDDEPVQRSDDLQPWRRKNQSELRRYQNCNFSPFEHEEYRPKR